MISFKRPPERRPFNFPAGLLFPVRVDVEIIRFYDPAGQTPARVPGRLGTVVIGVFVNNYCMSDNRGRLKFVREEGHGGISVIGEQDGQIPGMIAMRLPGRVPVPACGQKGVFRVAGLAGPVFMDMETVRPNRLPVTCGWLIGRETPYFRVNFCAAGVHRKM